MKVRHTNSQSWYGTVVKDWNCFSYFRMFLSSVHFRLSNPMSLDSCLGPNVSNFSIAMTGGVTLVYYFLRGDGMFIGRQPNIVR